MLLNPQAYNALASVEIITPRILIATINANPKTTVISCYNPTNVSDEVEVERFYENLTSVTRQIPKHNFLVITGDFNAHLGQLDGLKYAYHYQTNRNGSMLKRLSARKQSPMPQHPIPEKTRTTVNTQITKWKQCSARLYHHQSQMEKQCENQQGF